MKPTDPSYAFWRENHELGHVLVAVALGLPVTSMSVVRDEAVVRVTPGTAAQLPLTLLSLIAGPIAEQNPIKWPPDEKSENDDERWAAGIVRLLKMDQAGWLEAHSIVRDFLNEPDTRRASRELSYELRLHGDRLTGEQIYAATRGLLWEEAG